MRDRYGAWAVWDGSASAEYSEPPASADKFPTEEMAYAHAHRLEEETTIVEYGVQSISVAEQKNALIWQLRDLAERLDRLNTTGSQWELRED